MKYIFNWDDRPQQEYEGDLAFEHSNVVTVLGKDMLGNTFTVAVVHLGQTGRWRKRDIHSVRDSDIDSPDHNWLQGLRDARGKER